MHQQSFSFWSLLIAPDSSFLILSPFPLQFLVRSLFPFSRRPRAASFATLLITSRAETNAWKIFCSISTSCTEYRVWTSPQKCFFFKLKSLKEGSFILSTSCLLSWPQLVVSQRQILFATSVQVCNKCARSFPHNLRRTWMGKANKAGTARK